MSIIRYYTRDAAYQDWIEAINDASENVPIIAKHSVRRKTFSLKCDVGWTKYFVYEEVIVKKGVGSD